MRGTIPPLLQFAFMAWCSVKAQRQLYLYLWNISVCIVTGKGGDDQGLFPARTGIFLVTTFIPAVGSTQPPVQRVKLTSHLHLVLFQVLGLYTLSFTVVFSFSR
jgi:hypothetical protein